MIKPFSQELVLRMKERQEILKDTQLEALKFRVYEI